MNLQGQMWVCICSSSFEFHIKDCDLYLCKLLLNIIIIPCGSFPVYADGYGWRSVRARLWKLAQCSCYVFRGQAILTTSFLQAPDRILNLLTMMFVSKIYCLQRSRILLISNHVVGLGSLLGAQNVLSGHWRLWLCYDVAIYQKFRALMQLFG